MTVKKALTAAELAQAYDVSISTFLRWIKPVRDQFIIIPGQKLKRIYLPHDVDVIEKHLGPPVNAQ
jgi:predicted DNA-binding transcriptional regulator YafY